jgi:hypothetical protein
MRWLMNRLHRGERGAIAVIVTVLVGGGVLLGMGALVVDTGQMYSERAQLQNGADAGVLMVALGCAKGTANCTMSVASLNNPKCDSTPGASSGIAGCNANDGATKIDQVCGSGSGLSPCTGPQTDCPTWKGPGSYAQVQTSTLNQDGTTLLPAVFGRAVLGNSYDKTVHPLHACAQAAWSAPAGLQNAVAFTISYCEWQQDVATDGSFATYPPWPPSFLDVKAGTPAAKAEHVLVLHGDSGSKSCNAGNDSAGWDAPGAFGWVGDGSTCSVKITNNTYPANTGANAINACASTFQAAYSSHQPIYIPVYDGTVGTGNNVIYTLKGFAAFILTGWNLNSGQSGWKGAGGTVIEPSLIALSKGQTPTGYCQKPLVASNSDVCVFGFFTQALIPASALPTGSGTPLGATSVRLTG